MNKIITTLWLLLSVPLLISCGTMSQRTDELLAQNYQELGDAELQHYYQQLGDQLARQARAARKAGKAAEAEGEAADGSPAGELRQRWNAVRQELDRRELLAR